MKKNFAIVLLLLFASTAFAQQTLISGDYNDGLSLAYDPKTKLISGYYENHTGWDETTNNPKFSCIFYIEGRLQDGKAIIKTYFPTEEKEDLIEGLLEIVNNNKIEIKLNDEHGGCWNVEHFTNEPVRFELGTPQKWFQISYVKAPKSYFYKATVRQKKEINI